MPTPQWLGVYPAMLTPFKADDTIGRKIVELRERAGLTQRELAKRIGATASVISRLEDGDYDGQQKR